MGLSEVVMYQQLTCDLMPLPINKKVPHFDRTRCEGVIANLNGWMSNHAGYHNANAKYEYIILTLSLEISPASCPKYVHTSGVPVDRSFTRLLFPTLGAPTRAMVGRATSTRGKERSFFPASRRASTCRAYARIWLVIRNSLVHLQAGSATAHPSQT